MIAFCFLVSGITALVSEIVWLRMLELHLGHAAPVVSAALAGLALGSLLAARVADRRARRMVVYGALACVAGVWSALLPALLTPAAAVLVPLIPGPAALASFGVAFALLLPATLGFGAALPLVARAATGDAATVAREVGSLHAVYAVGGLAGAAVAGYALLPALGATATLRLAAALGVANGLLAMAIGRRRDDPPPAPAPLAPTPILGGPVLAALGLAGAAALIEVIAWTRVLDLLLGPSTYALTAGLVAMLAALGVGSALFARLLAAGARPETLAGLLAGAAVSALAMIPTFDWFPELVAREFSLGSERAFVLVVQLAMSLFLTLVPSLLLGAVFPCAIGVLARDPERIGRSVARGWAATAAGASVGAGLAGVAVIAGLGVVGAVKAAAVLQLLAAAVALAGSFAALPRWQRAAALAVAAAIVAAVALTPGWNRSVMASGVGVYGSDYGRLIDKISIADFMRSRRLRFYEDGPVATVTVHEAAHRVLRVDGVTEATSGQDLHTQMLLGHLPLIAHPAPRRVLVIGLGTGATVAAVARHPVERIDVVESEPALTRAARLFERENRDVLADPRVRLVVAGAREVLRAAPDRWDVIVSGTSSPWMRDAAPRFTAEFYALAAARLAPGGLMVQRVQGAAMAPADVRSVVATFRRAFPATTTWSAARGDYVLLGRAAPRPLLPEDVAARYAANDGLREDFERAGLIAAPALFADLALDEAETARWAEGAAVSTDDRLPLAFSAPWSLYADTTEDNWRLVRAFRKTDLPRVLDGVEARYAIGVAYVAKGLPDEALAAFNRALARDPGHVPSLLARGRLRRARGEPAEALASLEAAARRAPEDAAIQYEIGAARQAQGGAAAALPAYARAVALAPERVDYLRAYATALAQAGQAQAALGYLLLARAFRPRDPALMDLAAFAYLEVGNAARAVELLETAVAAAPDEAVYHFRLGQAQVQNRKPEAAIAELRRATELRPDFVEAHLELANTYLATERVGAAVAEYRRVIALDPRNSMALRVLTALGR